MRKLTILSLVAVLSACDNYGDTISEHGTTLISIQHKVDKDHWTEEFSYDPGGRLIEITKSGNSQGKYIITYQDDKVYQYITLNKDGVQIGRDSFAYDSLEQVKRVFNFYGVSMEPAFSYDYEYDNQGHITQMKTNSLDTTHHSYTVKYYWENGNVVRKEEFLYDENVSYEFVFTYDDKLNYKNTWPYWFYDPVAGSKNNIIDIGWQDFEGNLEMDCSSPCNTEYNYNLDKFPVKIRYEGGYKMVLSYE